MNVSVVIPFYKGEEFFADCIESVRQQTIQASEIIIINDSPSQESKDFLHKFDREIKIIHLDKNYNVSTARNIGIANCKSEFIAFLDNDDLWLPDKLERQLAILNENSEISAVHTGTVVFSGQEDKDAYLNKPSTMSLDKALTVSAVLPSALMIRKSVIESVGGFDPRASGSEDRDLTIRLLENGYRIDFINEVLVKFRRGDHDFASKFWKPKFRAHWYLFVKHFRLYLRYNMVSTYASWMFLHASYRSSGPTSVFFKVLGKMFSIASRDSGDHSK